MGTKWGQNNLQIKRGYRLLPVSPVFTGAPGMIRTCDTRIRNPVLYPLSYGGYKRKSDTIVPTLLSSSIEPLNILDC